MKTPNCYGLLLALLSTNACTHDAGDSYAARGGVADGVSTHREVSDLDGSVVDAGETSPAPLYAIMYEIYTNDESDSYLSILDSLDIHELDPSKGREFAGGRAYVATYQGVVYVGSPSDPRVTRYTVSDDGRLNEAGVISFANFGVTTGSLDAWNVTFINSHKAYLLNFEQGNTLIWDPTSMEILGEIPAPDELIRDGLTLDGSPAFVRGNRLFRSFHFVDFDNLEYSRDTLLVSYNTDTDEVVHISPQTRCPALANILQQDEAGDVYFSNWIWSVAGTLMHDAPEMCVLRIRADADGFDPNWELRYSELFDGRQGAQFSYIADGQALAAVFHSEETSFDTTTDPWEYAGGPFWQIYGIDLATNETTPVSGIAPNAGAFTPVRLDGREFLMVPSADWSATDVYELDHLKADLKVHIPGWSYQFVKIR